MKNFIKVLFAGLIIAGGLFAITNNQLIKDHYVVQTTDIASDAQQLAEASTFTDKGLFLYQASQAEVLSADDFNHACSEVSKNHSIVLGCYSDQRIYIFDVTDSRLSGVKEVTAAHELLHAVYERMSENKKSQMNIELDNLASSIQDERFQRTIDEYRSEDNQHFHNELHSIIGTEIEDLPQILEDHYANYFKNRQTVVDYAQQYSQTFMQIESDINDYDQRRRTMADQKESLESRAQSQRSQLDQYSKQLDRLQRSGDTNAYNQALPAYNDLVARYNRTVRELESLVSRYNQIVEDRNQLAATLNDLANKLDSNYQPISQ